jgi:hypothetical protein
LSGENNASRGTVSISAAVVKGTIGPDTERSRKDDGPGKISGGSRYSFYEPILSSIEKCLMEKD